MSQRMGTQWGRRTLTRFVRTSSPLRTAAYGHRARKLTWLCYVGERPPPQLDWRQPRGSGVVTYMSRRGDGSMWTDERPRLTKREAKATPPAFRDLLIQIADGLQ